MICKGEKISSISWRIGGKGGEGVIGEEKPIALRRCGMLHDDILYPILFTQADRYVVYAAE